MVEMCLRVETREGIITVTPLEEVGAHDFLLLIRNPPPLLVIHFDVYKVIINHVFLFSDLHVPSQ